MFKFHVLSQLAFLLFCYFMTSACGEQVYVTEHIRDFRFYVETSDDEVLQAIRLLTQNYNDDIGFDAISLVDNKAEANSFILFPRNLRDSHNVLGYGHWSAIMTEEGRDLIPKKKTLQRTIQYSMELEFDYDNFKEKSARIAEKNSGAWEHLYHLFSHEVGHGLHMDHEENKTSVMYMTIPEKSHPDVDYTSYFRRAQNAFELAIPLANKVHQSL